MSNILSLHLSISSSSISVWHFIAVLLALLISVIKYYRRKRQIQRNNNDDDAISTEIEELDGCDT